MTTPLHSLTCVPLEEPVLVAELSNAHNGVLRNAELLIWEALHAGADVVKFQAYTPDELVALRGDGPAPAPWGAQGWTMRRLYERARTPLEWFPRLVELCGMLDIPWFASVFGPDSLAAMQALDCPVYKLASLDAEAVGLSNLVCGAGMPVIRSWPGEVAPTTNDTWLYCPPGYPQAKGPVEHMEERGFGGFSYHGTDPMVPSKAVAFGAKIIEVHFQLDDPPSALEAHVSFTPEAFRAMRTACGRC